MRAAVFCFVVKHLVVVRRVKDSWLEDSILLAIFAGEREHSSLQPMTRIFSTSLLKSLLTSLLLTGCLKLLKYQIHNLYQFLWKTIPNQFLQFNACIVTKNVCAEVWYKIFKLYFLTKRKMNSWLKQVFNCTYLHENMLRSKNQLFFVISSMIFFIICAFKVCLYLALSGFWRVVFLNLGLWLESWLVRISLKTVKRLVRTRVTKLLTRLTTNI
jgi:hypothetical protein